MIIMHYGAATHIGNIRKQNEDSYICAPEIGLWVVADGVGGYKGGEIASKIAVDSLASNVTNGLNLIQAVEKAHQEIIDAPKFGVGSAGMSTTVAGVKICDDGCDVIWVGDSRVYLLRNGDLKMLSTDHSYAQELFKAGDISAEEVSTHPSRNILTRCLGMKGSKYVIQPGYCHINLNHRDRLLLCTDGLYGELSKQEMCEQLSEITDDQELAEVLISKVLEKEAKDNITAIVVSICD